MDGPIMQSHRSRQLANKTCVYISYACLVRELSFSKLQYYVRNYRANLAFLQNIQLNIAEADSGDKRRNITSYDIMLCYVIWLFV